MASVNLVRKERNSGKRGVCVAVGKLIPANLTTADGVAADGTLASGDVVTFANLPANAVVVNAFIRVKEGATTGTQTLKISIGGTDAIAAVAVGTADNAIKGGTVTRVDTATGAAFTATSGVGALTDGVFECVVEYVETELVTGELTNI